MKNAPFEGNLIRGQDYVPRGCQEKPHWYVVPGEEGPVAKACPGRAPVEEFKSEEGEVLGYRLTGK